MMTDADSGVVLITGDLTEPFIDDLDSTHGDDSQVMNPELTIVILMQR